MRSQVIDQLTGFIALALMLGMAFYLGLAYSPNPTKRNPKAGNPGESELIREFSQLNPEAQRGAIRYIKEMRKGYQKVKELA